MDAVAVGAIALLLGLLAISQSGVSRVPVIAWTIGIASLCGIAFEWRRGRLLSLEFITYTFLLTSFCIRPLYIWSNRTQLQFHEFPKNAKAQLENLTSLELANFVTNRFAGDLEGPMTVALGLGGAFLVCFVIGLAVGYRATSSRMPRLLEGRPAAHRLAFVVALLLIVGFGTQLAGQVGVGGALLSPGSFEAAVLIRSAVVGLLLWAAYGPLRGRWGLVFSAVTLAFVLLRATGGSRTEALLPLLAILIVIHLARRPFRAREVGAFIVIGLMVTNTVLTARVVATREPGASAILAGLKSSTSPSVALGDNSLFDDVVLLTATVPEQIPFQHGGRLLAGVASSVPSIFYPGKPEQNEITFRRLVWGELYEGGRPYTHIGEFWFDFGWPGVLIGSVLVGVLVARLRALGRPLARGVDPGAAVIAGILVPLFYLVIDGTYTILLSGLITYAVPLLLATFALRRSIAR